MKTLTIKLAGPLQSYGNEASFVRRTSDAFPSKSAIVGMLAAALGYQREDERIQKLAQLSFAVRVDQPGSMLQDYQTVEWKKDTRKVTYRDYIQDAVYVAAVGCDDAEEINRLKYALRHPKFQLYLGRRSNVPAGVLKLTTPDTDPVSALRQMDWQAADWFQSRTKQGETYSARLVADADLIANTSTKVVKDQAESFSQRNRAYTFRTIGQIYVPLQRTDSAADQTKTDHDVFGWLS
jgi:CRISPR system Cascade subunit CasD